MLYLKSISFKNYKGFKNFSISFQKFNVLVGVNNAGKSTIIESIKLLAEGVRKARNKNPEIIKDPDGNDVRGYEINLKSFPFVSENIFYNYDDSSCAIIKFFLSDDSILQIFFPENDRCFFNYISDKSRINSVRDFKKYVDFQIGYVPVLGPVDYQEKLYQKEAAKSALMTRTASRNFRNIWYHFNSDFEDFKRLVIETWPGFDIKPPEIIDGNLLMFCPEDRIPREIYWAGFGFQVWCQILTYIVKNKNVNLFMIDEPDIYLHSDLQRQLLFILQDINAEVIIATHSTEIISEVEPENILVVNRKSNRATKLKQTTGLRYVFDILGSNLNPYLTQIAKTGHILFVEGKDFSILARFAKILGKKKVATKANFAVITLGGFNVEKFSDFRDGISKTIGYEAITAFIFDGDYRCEEERESIVQCYKSQNTFPHIHTRKELENFLLIPSVIKSTIESKIRELVDIDNVLNEILNEMKNNTFSQLLSYKLKYWKTISPSIDQSNVISQFKQDFDKKWDKSINERLKVVSGKEVLKRLNVYLQGNFGISISLNDIFLNIKRSEVPQEIQNLIEDLDTFQKSKA